MIVLHCIREGGKLRVKFHCFVNHENNIFTNVYNNNYNCMFPKEIRTMGTFYRINDTDINLSRRNGRPYYCIKRKNIVIMTEQEKQQILSPTSVANRSDIQIFDAGDCVICLSVPSLVAFVPCGHRCVCLSCNTELKKNRYNCPVCRAAITENILD